jgi:hypothetical protein
MHNAAGRNQIKTATPAEANINDSAKPKEAEDEGADESSTEEDLADVENNLVDEKIGSSSQDVHVHPVTTSQAIETISSTPVPNLNPQKPLVDNDPSAEDPNTVHHGKDLYEGTEAPNVISSTEAPISSPSPSTNVKEEEEVQGLSSINNVTTLDNSPENFHANEASEKTTEASSMSIKQSESTTAKPSIQQSINALTTPILTTTTPADEEVLEDEQSIWQRIIHGKFFNFNF